MRRWRDQGEDGIQVFEFVLVLPFVLILVFLLVEMTAALQTWMTLEHASREGARAAAVRDSQSDVVAATVARSNGLLSAGDVAVSGAGSPTGSNVQVTVTYQYVPNSPLVSLVAAFLGGSVPSFTMQAQTNMRIE